MTVDDPLVILIGIKDRLIGANNALAVAAQMSADNLETLGEPVKANFLRHCITTAASVVADVTVEFSDLLRRSEEERKILYSTDMEVYGQLEVKPQDGKHLSRLRSNLAGAGGVVDMKGK